MTGIDVVASGPCSAGAFRLTLVPCHPVDEGLLFVRVCLPQEASHFVVTNANAFEQVLDAGGRITDRKGGGKPVTDLVGVAEAAGADFVLESLDLRRGKIARVALVMNRAEAFEPCVTKDTEPLAQLADADPQQFGDVFSGFARSNRQNGGQALVNAPVKTLLASAFDFLALLGSQRNRLHG